MPMRRAAILAFLILGVTSGANAQEVQKAGGSYFVQTVSGAPRLCGYEFTTVFLDKTYKQGALSAVAGSLVWADGKNGFALLLKVNGIDYPGAEKLDMTMQRFRPYSAYLASANEPTMAAKPGGCEDPLSFCSVIDGDGAVQGLTQFLNGNLELVFNRIDGGLDIRLPVKEDVSDPTFVSGQHAFAGCLKAVHDRLETGSIK
jgi:hypothetical protein